MAEYSAKEVAFTIMLPRCPADSSGMVAFLLVFGVNLLITIAAFLRERGEDGRFAGDKLGYRS